MCVSFFFFICSRLGAEKARNLETPTSINKINTNKRALSLEKGPGKGQLSKAFRK